MAGPKSTLFTRAVGIKTDEMHPYILLSSNWVSMKKCRDASHLLLSLLFSFAVYFLALPSLLTSSIYFTGNCVLYLYVLFSSIVTESEGHGLLNSLWHEAMHRYGQVSLCVVYPSLDPSETATPSCSTAFNILEYDLSATKTALKYGEYVTCTPGLARAR